MEVGKMTKIICFMIVIYQRFLSPLTYPSCRYLPSCSSYTLEAVKRFGACKGMVMGLRRILSCCSRKKWVYDPVPDYRPGWKEIFFRKGA